MSKIPGAAKVKNIATFIDLPLDVRRFVFFISKLTASPIRNFPITQAK